MIGYGLDRGGPKDSETAPNSFLTEINGNVFWHFAPDMVVWGLLVQELEPLKDLKAEKGWFFGQN